MESFPDSCVGATTVYRVARVRWNSSPFGPLFLMGYRAFDVDWVRVSNSSYGSLWGAKRL